MEDLIHHAEQLSNDFDEFERMFLQPYNPHSTDLQCMPNSMPSLQPENSVTWLEQMEMSFVDTQLDHQKFYSSDHKSKIAKRLYNQTTENSGSPSYESSISNVYDPMSLDDLVPFDPSVIALIDFDYPTSSLLMDEESTISEIDSISYIDKAETGHGEGFGMRMAENVMILQEEMGRKSECCIAGIKGDKICCKGKCWASLESRWKQVQKIPRGRRKKGFELNPEIREFCRERQKIKNRISATNCYRRKKAHIHDLEVQVVKLKAENKIRRNLVKYLESSLQLQPRKRSLRRTISGPL